MITAISAAISFTSALVVWAIAINVFLQARKDTKHLKESQSRKQPHQSEPKFVLVEPQTRAGKGGAV